MTGRRDEGPPGDAAAARHAPAAARHAPAADPSTAADPSVAPGVVVRPATPSDVDQIYAWIVELAEYERAPDKVTGTRDMLHESLFGASRQDDVSADATRSPDRGPRGPVAEALIAERAGRPVGFAVFHGSFSTWECRPGIWLEDLYVPVSERRGGVGAALLVRLAELAVQRGCARLEWHVLDWNEPALAFYERIGAQRLLPWHLHRLDGEALARVARGRR